MSRNAKREEKKVSKSSPSRHLISVVGLIVILCLTFFIYQSVTKFDSTNWDDKAYLKETPLVRDLNFEKVKAIFSQKFMLSYNPVVLLTFAFDSEMADMKPGWCHGVNLFFHLMNVVLLFFCLRQLKFNELTSLIITFLFAIHPLATEAVVWIAGRKDVVYLFFFLLSWVTYLRYYHTKKMFFYLLSLFFCSLSLLSKVQAITLPFVLIISDLMLDEKFNVKRLYSKIPFIIMSLIIGVVAVSGGGELVADKYAAPISFLDQIIYSVMAFGQYLIKIIIPFNQIAIHQFPVSGDATYIPYLIVGSLLVIAVIVSIIIFYKKNPRLTGSLLFFSICIFPVLHIVAVNSALIYERFTYLAAVGIFMAVFTIFEKKPELLNKISYLLIGFGLFFSALTYARIPVWKNSIALWTDVIKKDPTVVSAFNNRGQFLEQSGDIDNAFLDFSEVIKLAPERPDGYHNRSVIYFQRKDIANALLDNEKAMLLDPKNTDVLVNRGNLYYNLNKNDSAIIFYNKALAIKPDHAKANYDCATAYFKAGQYSDAIKYYKKAIEIIPDFHDAFVYMAVSYISIDSIPQAKFAIDKADRLVPNSAARTLVSSQLIKLGNSAFQRSNVEESLRLYNLAAEILPSNAEAYYNLGGIYFSRKNVNAAKENWEKALALKPDYTDAKIWLQRIGALK